MDTSFKSELRRIYDTNHYALGPELRRIIDAIIVCLDALTDTPRKETRLAAVDKMCSHGQWYVREEVALSLEAECYSARHAGSLAREALERVERERDEARAKLAECKKNAAVAEREKNAAVAERERKAAARALREAADALDAGAVKVDYADVSPIEEYERWAIAKASDWLRDSADRAEKGVT